MPSFYDYAPGELRALPFNARRSQLYPLNMPTAAQAIDDALAGRHASAYLPQKMTYSRFKNGPAAIDYAENVVGVLGAQQSAQDFVYGIVDPITRNKGVYTARMASHDMVRLPQVRDNVYMEQDPITRGLLQRPIVQTQALDAYAQSAASPLNAQPTVYENTLLSSALEWPATPPMTGLGRVRRKLLRGLGGLGLAIDPGDEPQPGQMAMTAAEPTPVTPQLPRAVVYGYTVLGTLGFGLGLYHGWNRTRSTGWTLVWGAMGAWAPIVVLPLMFIQGFAKKG